MSTSPETFRTVEFTADAGYPNAEITLLDSQYQLAAEGVGKISTKLNPGFYKIRYRAGNAVNEQIFEVSPQTGSIVLPPPKWSLQTAAPIADSSSTPAVEEFARSLSRLPAADTEGAGSEMFVFARAAEGETQTLPPQFPTKGLSLLDFSGKLLFDFSQQPAQEGCAGRNVGLAPGCYLLRLDCPNGPSIEQTIVASEGWQTQVFLPVRRLSGSDFAPAPDLSNAAILMSLQGVGFDPSTPQFAWTESARQELALGRPVVPEERVRQAVNDAKSVPESLPPAELREMLQFKFTNPMLGIYAAHRMFMLPKPDEDLLREVARNLRRLVGDHPDVLVIDLWLDAKAPVPPFQVPPMLRSSWSILVNRSRNREDLVPAGSYAFRASRRLWGSGAWLVWCQPEPVQQIEAHAPALEAAGGISGVLNQVRSWYWNLGAQDINAIFQWVRQQLTNRTATDLIAQESEAMVLSGLERDTFVYVVHLAEQQTFVEKIADQITRTGTFGPVAAVLRRVVPSAIAKTASALTSDLAKSSIVARLGVPQAAVAAALTGLETKFRLMRLTREYDLLRETMTAGDQRTMYMEQLAAGMKSLAGLVEGLLSRFQSSESAGKRLAVVMCLEAKPRPDMIPWLGDRFGEEKPFIGYHAALALVAAVRTLMPAERDTLEHAITKGQQALAQKQNTDRYRMLETALNELAKYPAAEN